jgi:electron transfer flavoprotein alpha subunit
MSRLLIVAFNPSEAAAMHGFAHDLGLPYDLLVIKAGPVPAIGALRLFQSSLGSTPPADSIATSLARICAPYSHVAAMSSMRAKDVLARTAGILDAAMVTDVVAVDNPHRFRRPMVAGAVIATVEVSPDKVFLTVRPSGFARPETADPNGPSEPVVLDVEAKARRIEAAAHSGGRPDLAQAKVIVSGGRPLKDADTFERLIGGLADALGGAAGATRAAVDAGIAPNELQVGQTGKIVAPDLYIAAGISGSTQHMAGIKDSKVIVAINTDPDAPIFEFADFGLVADLCDVLPELQQKLPRGSAV